jgi:hypothetical protein
MLGLVKAGSELWGGLAEAASEATLVNECSDVSSSESARGKCFFHCVGNVGFTVKSDKPLKFLQLVFEVDTAAGNLLYVDASLVREGSDSVAPTWSFGGRASLEHRVDVGQILSMRMSHVFQNAVFGAGTLKATRLECRDGRAGHQRNQAHGAPAIQIETANRTSPAERISVRYWYRGGHGLRWIR